MPRPQIGVGVSIILLVAPLTAQAQSSQQFFDDNCAMCHSIGGEPGGAPDLKDITKRRERDWLIRFIHDPEEAAEHDPEAARLVREFDNGMPRTEGASRKMLEALLDYIDAKSRSGPMSGETSPTATVPDSPFTAQDAMIGRDLYEGRRALAGGGPPCVSCHAFPALGGFGGGALGPDLTGVHQRRGGSQALATWMSNPPTPMMRAIYRGAPFNADEAHMLVALFAQEGPGPPAQPTTHSYRLLTAGFAGMCAALLAMSLAWSRRFRGVRRALVERAAGGRRE